MACTRQSNADTILHCQKTDILLLVTSYERKQNYVVLFTLKIVYSSDSDTFKSELRHSPLQGQNLTRVHRQHRYLITLIPLQKEVLTERCNVFCFMLI